MANVEEEALTKAEQTLKNAEQTLTKAEAQLEKDEATLTNFEGGEHGQKLTENQFHSSPRQKETRPWMINLENATIDQFKKAVISAAKPDLDLEGVAFNFAIDGGDQYCPRDDELFRTMLRG
ncbi:5461_t:CDS:2, partial [Paraglomus occultum]